MDEIVKEFLVESHENLDRLDRDLITLEKDHQSEETLASVFRTIHTLKGTSGFLGFGKLEAVAHVGENLLSKLRDSVLTINPEITSALLATVDAVRFMLGQIESTCQPGDNDYSSLIDLLTRLNDGKSVPPGNCCRSSCSGSPRASASSDGASPGRLLSFEARICVGPGSRSRAGQRAARG